MANGNGAGGVQAARPTILVGGRADEGLAQGLLSLLIVENFSGLYRCEALVGNWGAPDNNIGFLYFDRQTLDFGKSFQIKLGSDLLFDGQITGLEGHFPEGAPPQITVLAEDRLQDLRMTRRTRTFAGVTDADVVRQVANDHGLTARVDLSGPPYRVLAQVNQSDLALLRERVRAIDGELWIDGRNLNAVMHSQRNGGSLQLTYGSELREFSVLADLARQRTSVTVSGWDVQAKNALKYEADDSILSGELNGGASGASVLQQALGQRKEALVHTVPLSSSEAQAEAEAYFKMTARRFLTGHGVAQPDAHLRVGSYVDLQSLGPLFSGKYYLAEVRHLFDGRRGLRTEFTAERPGLGR